MKDRPAMTRSPRVLLTAWIFLACPLTLLGASPDASWSLLARQAQTLQLTPPTAADLEAARMQLSDALDQAKARIQRFPESAASWNAFLEVPALDAALASPDVDLDLLARVAERLTWSSPGVDRPEFVALRAALQHYAAVSASVDETGTGRDWTSEAERLRAALDALAAGRGTSDDRRAVRQSIGWLASTGQASELSLGLARAFNTRNVHLRASEQLVNARLSEAFTDVSSICEEIEGTKITGRGNSRGLATVELEPSAENARLKFTFVGHTDARSVGRNGPVRFNTDVIVPFHIWTYATLTPDGQVIEPVRVQVSRTNPQVYNIQTDFRGVLDSFVTCIAERQIDKKRDDAEAASRAKAKKRYHKQFNERLEEERLKGEASQKELTEPLEARGLMPRHVRLASSDDHLFISMLAARGGQLGSAVPPPQWTSAGDLNVLLAESALENLAESLLAGERFDQERVAREAEDLLGEVPDALKPSDDSEVSAVTFASLEPARIRFSDNLLVFTLRFSAFESSDRKYTAMDVTARYRPEQTEDGWFLVLEELNAYPPEYDPVTNPRLGVRTKIQQRVLLRRFDDVFEERIDLNDPIDIKDDQDRVTAVIEINHVKPSEGWLELGYRQRP
jgi:hypothetical protein